MKVGTTPRVRKWFDCHFACGKRCLCYYFGVWIRSHRVHDLFNCSSVFCVPQKTPLACTYAVVPCLHCIQTSSKCTFCFVLDAIPAILPMVVCAPVRMVTPRPTPSTTVVPKNARQRASRYMTLGWHACSSRFNASPSPVSAELST